MEKRIPKGVLYGLVVTYLCIVAVVVAGILYTNYVNDRNNHRWCAVLKSIDDAYEPVSNNPNASSAAKHIAEEFHRLRIEFEC